MLVIRIDVSPGDGASSHSYSYSHSPCSTREEHAGWELNEITCTPLIYQVFRTFRNKASSLQFPSLHPRALATFDLIIFGNQLKHPVPWLQRSSRHDFDKTVEMEEIISTKESKLNRTDLELGGSSQHEICCFVLYPLFYFI